VSFVLSGSSPLAEAGLILQSTIRAQVENLRTAGTTDVLCDINRGIERECLRITPTAKLAQTPHPETLGSALKHDFITTDYAENLLEFITPVANDIQTTLAQLTDVHRFAVQRLGDELLWPLSMPCFVGDEQDIKIAQYGSSNIGRMKTLYRRGLTYRYGGAMQIISGVHYNFSVPNKLWEALAKAEGTIADSDFISRRYFDLIRNYKRVCWVIPYLFGASPAICQSFLKHAEATMEFESLGKGTVYRKYGTSLRMSDLGYTNKEQADLAITYNSLPEYVAGLRRAITRPSARFERIGVAVSTTDGNTDFRQLNSNILQIENEFYAPIRPKRVTKHGETPTQALERGGVEYIEVRALDVNPFSAIGITAEQIRFLDTFLLYCLFLDSPAMSLDEQTIADRNFNRVVMDGRNPRLTLVDDGFERPIADWLEDIFGELQGIATWLDEAHDGDDYATVISQQYRAVLNPELTLSGQFLRWLRDQQLDNSELGMQLAKQYKAELQQPLSHFTVEQFETWAQSSLAEQRALEQQDAGSDFAAFLREYFRRAACASPDCQSS
ncbi:MAG TPA: glutamate--cysteine ligase, partial [Pseudidiomarina sp.]|nr:glutamate--cysteine ligase [Pseudidiomarina sp.]